MKKKIRLLALLLTLLLCVGVLPVAAAENPASSGVTATAKTKIASVKLKYTTVTYSGKAKKPTVVVKAKVNGKTKTLTKNKDYTVSYKNNKNVGKATVIVKGEGKYTGTIKKTFLIYPKIVSIYLTGGKQKFIAKQGSKTLWARKTSAGTQAQLAGHGLLDCEYVTYTDSGNVYKVRNKAGLFYYYDDGDLIALNILTGKVKWKCKDILGAATSAASDSKGSLYVMKQSNPNDDTSNALLYTIDKKGKIVRTVNWSGGGIYSGSTSGGAAVNEFKDGCVVMSVELRGQWFDYRTIYVNPKTGEIVKSYA